MLPGFHLMLLNLNWVLLGFTGYYWVLLGITGFYWVLLGFIGFYWVLLGFAGFYILLRGFTGFYWVLLCFAGSCRGIDLQSIRQSCYMVRPEWVKRRRRPRRCHSSRSTWWMDRRAPVRFLSFRFQLCRRPWISSLERQQPRNTEEKNNNFNRSLEPKDAGFHGVFICFVFFFLAFTGSLFDSTGFDLALI